MSDWSAFDVFKLAEASGGRALQLVSLRLLDQLGLIQRLQLNITKLTAYFAAAEEHYGTVTPPYHNATHAADVVQALGSMMLADAWIEAFKDWEVLALVTAAAVHDLAHPGVNNDFHLRSNSPAAQMYHSIGSINENGHAHLAMSLLDPPETNFLQTLPADVADAFKALLKELILSTDMVHHCPLVEAFQATAQAHGADVSNWPAEGRQCALRMMLHCADISNPARPLAHCTEWGRRVQEELYSQGDKERELGLEVSSVCDRATSSAGRNQAVFIKKWMRPCIDALAPLAPNFVSSVTPYIENSLQHWQALAASLERKSDKVEGAAECDGNGAAELVKHIAP